MAILQKRTSTNKLPQARGLGRSPLSSIINDAENARPNAGFFESTRPEARRVTPASGVKPLSKINQRENISNPALVREPLSPLPPKAPITSKVIPATKPAVTKPPVTKPAVTKTPITTKPSITSKTTTPATKITTPTTSPVKPAITTKTTAPTSTTKTTPTSTITKPTVTKTTGTNNSVTNKIVNAVTGAVIGAGTKKLIDKITGKPVVKTTGNTGGTGGKTTTTPNTTGSKTTTTPKTTPKTTPSTPAGKVTPKTATPVTSKVLTDEEIQAELDKVKASEGTTGLPKGAVDNGDGTYSVVDGELKTIYDADGNVIGAEAADTKTADASDTEDGQYFTDEDGNVWSMDSGGAYTLFQYADGTSPDETTAEDNTYTDPDTGAVYTLGDDGIWTTDYVDTTVADNTDDTIDETDNTDYTVADNTDYTDDEPPEEVKRGGFITMMKQGGLPHFDDGGDVSYMPEDAEDNGDGTYTLDNVVYSMDSGNPLYTMDDNGKIIYVEPAAQSGYVDNGDGTYTLDGTTFDVDTDMPLYRDNPKGGVDYATDNNDGTYTVAGSTYSMDGNKRLYDTDKNGSIVNVSPDARYTTGNRLTDPTTGNNTVDKGFLDTITGALGTTAGAAGAGALLASLLGGDFGGGGGNQNQGVDMSKVGVINPRTTDFGIGPTRYVGYEDYGVSPDQDYTPNEELLKNLNAPGFNPVNEGDYGYADDSMPPDEEMVDEAKPPKMAAGGLSAMAPQPSQTHYTFGKPVDVYATLGLRDAPPAEPVDQPQPVMPQQGQQPQGPQGQPPAGMPMGLQKPPLQQMGTPQAMPPPMPAGIPQGIPPAGAMRKGGLPHVSNVPQVDGRFDFRQGSAVHGEGDGQSDDIPAMLADGEYVIDAETVAQIGNGSTKAGAQALDKFRENIRAHKRSAPLDKIPPKTKTLTSYLKGAK